VDFRKNPELSRYELVDGHDVVAIADYVEQGDVVIFPHTEVTPSRRAQGLGAEVVRGALDDVARSGRHVIPTCWFVAEFINSHKEYVTLLAA
jgi:predicted GNAT family acetyltransferase